MITVIYDEHCRLCQNSINWLAKKLSFTAIGYRQAPLESYGLSLIECQKQVYAISDGTTYGAVAAVIFLLKARGNNFAALLLKLSGPLGNFTYKLIAANRSSPLVRALSKLLEKLS